MIHHLDHFATQIIGRRPILREFERPIPRQVAISEPDRAQFSAKACEFHLLPSDRLNVDHQIGCSNRHGKPPKETLQPE